MWFGTQDGLNRYDGYGIKVYKHTIKQNKRLFSNIIQTLYEDRAGNLWVGSQGGILNIYDRENDCLSTYKGSKSGKQTVIMDVTCIKEDNEGNLWIGSSMGLYLLNREGIVFIMRKSGEVLIIDVYSARICSHPKYAR